MPSRDILWSAAACLTIASVSPAQASVTVQRILLGHSVQGRPITAVQVGGGQDRTLILGGIHGDEPSGSQLIKMLVRSLGARTPLQSGEGALIVPVVNPDGAARDTRINADGVDINRNFPARNWRRTGARSRFASGPLPASEPETKIIMRAIAAYHPCKIVSVHEPFRQLNIDGPALPLARAMQRFDHYRITRSIGYPTPGSLGAYAGKDRHIPVVTLELPPRLSRSGRAQNERTLMAAIRAPC